MSTTRSHWNTLAADEKVRETYDGMKNLLSVKNEINYVKKLIKSIYPPSIFLFIQQVKKNNFNMYF